MLGERRSRLAVTMLLLIILLIIPNAIPITASSSSQTLYAHAETTTIGGVSYYLHKVSSADGSGITLSQSAATVGRKLMGRWVYPLSGIVSIPASTWTVTYRAMRSASATSVKAHGDIDILIRKSDNTIRTTIATNVANSPNITLVNAWQTLTATYNWAAYTVASQTDYLEVAYYIQVTTSQTSKYVRLSVDNGTLPLADQTKIQNVIFTYPNQAPVASFTFSPSNPVIYETVTFNASASNDPDGNIVSYKWDFGDGNITTVTNPIITHVYTTAQSTVNYTVTLTVTDNEGSMGSTTQNVPVTNPSILYVSLPAGTYVGPDPDNWLSQCWLFSITGLDGTFTIRINNTHASWSSYDTHLIIALNNASYEYLDSLAVDATTIPKTSFIYGTPEPYGFTLTWEEDVYPTWFSDVYLVGTVDPKSYKDMQVSVTFSNTTGVRMHFDAYGSTCSPPPPTGKGRVTDNPHEKDSTVLFCPPIVKLPPHADFTWEPPSPQVCETVTFNASASYDPDGYIVNYTWNFGDSNTTTVKNQIITHHYTTFGNYTVTLTVTDNDGLTNSTVKTITVRKHPVANFTWSPFSPQVGELVTFNGSLSTPDGGYIVNYAWDFDDGEKGSGKIVTHAYLTYGNFIVTLNVTDSEGKWDTESKTITVREHPHADFSWSPDSPEVGETVSFNGCLSTPDGGTIVSYEWDFGDETLHGFGKIVTHVYNKNGTFTVTLNVTDSEGKWDTESKSITVRVKKYYLTVVSPYGITGGQGWYDNCSTAYATLDTGIIDHGNGTRRIFTHWSGDASGTNYSKSDPIHMDGNKTAIANWKTQYRLTVRTSGLGTRVTNVYNGTTVLGTATDATPYTDWFDKNSLIQLDIDSPVTGSPTRFVFTQWSGDATGTNRPVLVTMNSVKDVTANYKTQYQITVTASPSGALGGTFKVTYIQCGTTYTNVQKTTPWTEWVDASTDVTVSEPQNMINVSPNTRYKFDSYNPSASVHMDQAKTITLVYKIQYLLVVRTDPPGLTPPTRNPAGEAGPPDSWWYDNSTNVLLTAQSVMGYTFLYWNVSGKSRGNGVNPITVHMNQTHTAIAHYTAPKKCVVDFTEKPDLDHRVYNGTTVTFTVQVLQKAFNGTHEINCTLYEWNLTDPNGVSRILRFGKQWNNFSNSMQWTFNILGDWKVTLRAWCDDATLINLGMAWSDPASHTKKVIAAVGGYIAPIDKLSLLAPLMDFAMALVATVALTTLLIRRKGKRSVKV